VDASSFLDDDDDTVRAVVVVVPFPSSELIGVDVDVDVVVSPSLVSSASTLLVDTTSVPVLEHNEIGTQICWVGSLRQQPASRNDPSSPPTPSTSTSLVTSDAVLLNDMLVVVVPTLRLLDNCASTLRMSVALLALMVVVVSS